MMESEVAGMHLEDEGSDHEPRIEAAPRNPGKGQEGDSSLQPLCQHLDFSS